MSEQRYTLTEIADMMRENKWHLLSVEEALAKGISKGYGNITIRFDLRAGQVEKMTVINTEETILRPKEGHPDQGMTQGFFVWQNN